MKASQFIEQWDGKNPIQEPLDSVEEIEQIDFQEMFFGNPNVESEWAAVFETMIPYLCFDMGVFGKDGNVLYHIKQGSNADRKAFHVVYMAHNRMLSSGNPHSIKVAESSLQYIFKCEQIAIGLDDSRLSYGDSFIVNADDETYEWYMKMTISYGFVSNDNVNYWKPFKGREIECALYLNRKAIFLNGTPYVIAVDNAGDVKAQIKDQFDRRTDLIIERDSHHISDHIDFEDICVNWPIQERHIPYVCDIITRAFRNGHENAFAILDDIDLKYLLDSISNSLDMAYYILMRYDGREVISPKNPAYGMNYTYKLYKDPVYGVTCRTFNSPSMKTNKHMRWWLDETGIVKTETFLVE